MTIHIGLAIIVGHSSVSWIKRGDRDETASFLGLGCGNLHDHGHGHGL